MPSSYHSQNVNASFGVDLADDTKIEFRYLRQDQTGVELAGQFSDIDFLKTDGYVINFTSENQGWFDRLRWDVWYNRTAAEGNTSNASKQALFNSVFTAPFAGLPNTLPRGGNTDFDVMSLGTSLGMT